MSQVEKGVGVGSGTQGEVLALESHGMGTVPL